MIKRVITVCVILIMTAIPSHCYEIQEYITPEMTEILPSDILDEDNVIDYESLADMLISGISGTLERVVNNLFVILGAVILSALFSVFSETICTEGIKNCFSFLSSACIAMMVFGILLAIWNDMSDLLYEINSFMTGVTPVTTLLYSMGGNITSAAVNNTAMSIILTVFEKICYYGIRPMLQICFGFSVISVLSGSVNLRPISGFVRKTYTTVLVFSISMMTCILSLQNLLSRSNDSLAMKTVKFASASSVPLVGGCLSEATETVASGIGSIRTTFGVLAIIAVLIMVIPELLSLWLNKMAFSVASTVASVFGLSKEGEIVSDACELVNFAIAISVTCSVMFIICLGIFAGASCAIGG